MPAGGKISKNQKKKKKKKLKSRYLRLCLVPPLQNYSKQLLEFRQKLNLEVGKNKKVPRVALSGHGLHRSAIHMFCTRCSITKRGVFFNNHYPVPAAAGAHDHDAARRQPDLRHINFTNATSNTDYSNTQHTHTHPFSSKIEPT